MDSEGSPLELNVIITGFMATGKSTVAPLVAQMLGFDLVDCDEAIASSESASPAAIIESFGEEVFRRLESELAIELADRTSTVIATGGGLLLDQDNSILLSRNGLIFTLAADSHSIAARVDGTTATRPLLDETEPEPSIERLLRERDPIYRLYHQIDTSGREPAEIAAEIVATYRRLLEGNEWTRPQPVRIDVTHPVGSYPYLVGSGLLSRLPELIALGGPVAIITDTNVGRHHLHLLDRLDTRHIVVVTPGEQSKTLQSASSIYSQLAAAGVDRTTAVVALGGGVVGDLAGHVAATYLRGLPLILCPTTLLSMIDASIGGKCAVDLPEGKNLVGAFKQPDAIIADLDTLVTLPPEEVPNGLAEIVKHALLSDSSLLQRLQGQAKLLQRPAPTRFWQDLILSAARIKIAVVEEDPFETGRRAFLNLGHTFAHAVEQVSGYTIPHGRAVAIGLVAATDLSHRLGHCRPEVGIRLRRLLHEISLPSSLPADLSPEDLWQAMSTDKKNVDRRRRFVLLNGPERPFLTTDVSREDVLATLSQLQD